MSQQFIYFFKINLCLLIGISLLGSYSFSSKVLRLWQRITCITKCWSFLEIEGLTNHLHLLHWSYPGVLLLLGFVQEISSLFPVPLWWLYRLHPCQTARTLLWILNRQLAKRPCHRDITRYYNIIWAKDSHCKLLKAGANVFF